MSAWMIAALSLCLVAESPVRPRVTLWTVGEPRIGPLERIDVDGTVALAGSDTPTLAGEIVSIRRADVGLPDWPDTTQVILSNGDRLVGRVLSADSSSFQWEPHWENEEDVPPEQPHPAIRIPFSSASVIWLRPPNRGESTDVQRAKWLPPNRKRDLLRLSNGDLVMGTFLALDRSKGVIRWRESNSDTGEVTIDLPRVVAIAFNPALTRTRKPTTPHWAVTFTNGSRLTCSTLSLRNGKLSAKTPFGETFELSVSLLASADRMQGPAAYLSELKPTTSNSASFGDVAWPIQMDRNCLGEPLRLGNQTFDRGIGMHSKATIEFPLNGKWDRFEAIVGLDDLVGKQGEVEIRVYVDGKIAPLAAPSERTHAQGPKWLRIDVQGAKSLTLEVALGKGGDIQDHVNWCDARLIRAQK